MAKIEDLRIDGPIPRPRRKRSGPWGVVFWVVASAGAGWYLLQDRLPQFSTLLASSRRPAVVEVLTAPDVSAAPPGAINAGGYLEVIPPGAVVASTLVAGKLATLEVVEGDRVRRGQVIARLDAGLYQQEVAVLSSRVELARAELERQLAGFRVEEIAGARADVAKAQASMIRAEADHGRAQQLFEAGVIPRSRLDETRSILDQARAEVQARQSQLDLLQAGTRREDVAIYEAALGSSLAELAQAQFNVASCSIVAPADGVIYEQLAQPGDWLAPNSGERTAGGVVSIFDPRQIQAWCDVNQRDSLNIELGQLVQLATDAQPGRVIKGFVAAIMPRANLQKNTVQVKISIPQPPQDLRPELAVKVAFLPREAPQAETKPAGVELPAGVVSERDGQAGIFLLEDGKARWRGIKHEVLAGGNVRVASGLRPGEQVILNPAGLVDGQSVKFQGEESK